MHALLLGLSLLAHQAPAAPAAPAAAPDPAAARQALVDDVHKHVEVIANNQKNLRAGLALSEKALQDKDLTKKQRASVLTNVARARLRLGDLAELRGKKKERLAEYEKGYTAAKQLTTLTPNSAEALFWEAAMLASLSNAKGVMNSLTSVPGIKRLLNKALKIDPNHSYAAETLAKVHHALPGIVGGDDDEAERLLLGILKRDPGFTPTMVTIADFYIDEGREDEARKWLTKCVNTPVKASSIPQDHWRFNLPDCKRRLKKLGGR